MLGGGHKRLRLTPVVLIHFSEGLRIKAWRRLELKTIGRWRNESCELIDIF